MSFMIRGLAPEQFQPLFSLSDAQLEVIGARRVVADDPRMPCRVSMAHAELGEDMLLLNFAHQTANTPYRSTHAIYVRRCATRQVDFVDVIPDILATRKLSVRAFDAQHMMIAAELCDGIDAQKIFEGLLGRTQTSYLHVHNAIRGCYAALVVRA